MKTIFSPKAPRILKNKKKLEKILNIKIFNRGKEIQINGAPQEEYFAEKVIDALNFGFSFSDAILIKEEGNDLDFLNIKEYSKSHNLERVRGRLIGKDGRCLKTLRKLTKCAIEVNENKVGIIGKPENIENTVQAIISIVHGAKQPYAYKFLERNQIKPIQDLGLRDED